MAAHKSVKSDSLSSVRTVISGAAPLGAMDVERFYKKWEIIE